MIKKGAGDDADNERQIEEKCRELMILFMP